MRYQGRRFGGRALRRLIARLFSGLIPAALLWPAAAVAADRTWPVASFERVQVEGPVDVEIAAGSPRAQASADERSTLDRLTVAVEGNVLVVRLPGLTGPARARVLLATPRLVALRHRGPGTVAVARLSGERVDVSTTGDGAVSVAAVDTPDLAATLVGKGRLTLSGRAARTRLILNGDGLLDAAALTAGEVDASLVGGGEVRGAGRYTARVVARGEGRVSIAGPMPCTVRSAGGAKVSCGGRK